MSKRDGRLYNLKMDLRKLLKKLQFDARSEGTLDGPWGRTQVIPDDLATEEAKMLHVGPAVSGQITELVEALLADLRFEHLSKDADKRVWRFVCQSALDRSTDHVAGFLFDNQKELRSLSIRFGIDHLEIGESFTLADVEFLPLPEGDTKDGDFFRHNENCGSVARVKATGTASDRMVMRAREHVAHAVRILRVSLAQQGLFHSMQLRFRVGEEYIIEERGRGFQRHVDAPTTLGLPKPPGEILANFSFLSVPHGNASKMQRQAALALKWLDEAQIATDPFHRVSFIFSALEAMLGDKSGGLKSRPLVFYRTTLGHTVTGSFPDPKRLYYLYDKVRSYVVHGEFPEFFTNDDVEFLERNIRKAFFELVDFYESRNIKTRAAVRAALREEAKNHLALDWLKSHDPENWPDDWSPDVGGA
ncbi:hypothetical protein [Streptomyces sp. NPDC090083]|uniref:hypothetical protein n=1 Tax=Streptomyces sp. NPDC090083 TaxID=3365941 RepID=UPI0037F7C4BA